MCTVDETGHTRDFSVLDTNYQSFANHAILAVQNWRFQPATKDGHPVPCRVRIPFKYRPGYPPPANDSPMRLPSGRLWQRARIVFDCRMANDPAMMPESTNKTAISKNGEGLACIWFGSGCFLRMRRLARRVIDATACPCVCGNRVSWSATDDPIKSGSCSGRSVNHASS